MILPFCSDLIFEDCNTINRRYQNEIRVLSLILLNLFDNFVKQFKEFNISSISLETC